MRRLLLIFKHGLDVWVDNRRLIMLLSFTSQLNWHCNFCRFWQGIILSSAESVWPRRLLRFRRICVILLYLHLCFWSSSLNFQLYLVFFLSQITVSLTRQLIEILWKLVVKEISQAIQTFLMNGICPGEYLRKWLALMRWFIILNYYSLSFATSWLAISRPWIILAFCDKLCLTCAITCCHGNRFPTYWRS